jgi:2'-5' RNA ligase
MRLFVAVVPPAAALAPAAAAVHRLRAAEPGLGWIPAERWHLTLVFLGEVAERSLPELTDRLARVAHRHPPVEVTVGGAGRFGRGVLWVGARGRLAPLAAGAARAAARTGIEVEDRAYRPHLTVARVRRHRPADLRPLVTALRELPATTFRADRLDLIRSHLGPAPRYERLVGWPLTGG